MADPTNTTNPEATPPASIRDVRLPNYVITYRTKHGEELFAATGENVLAWLSSAGKAPSLQEGLVALAAATNTEAGFKPFHHQWLWRALGEVVDAAEGALTEVTGEMRNLRRMFFGGIHPDQSVIIAPEWLPELLSWLAVNAPAGASLAPRQIVRNMASRTDPDADDLAFTTRCFEQLSFLAPVRARVGKVVFLSAGSWDECLEYQRLKRDAWKADAVIDETRSARILTQYLSFLSGRGHGSFDLCRVTASGTALDLSAY